MHNNNNSIVIKTITIIIRRIVIGIAITIIITIILGMIQNFNMIMASILI